MILYNYKALFDVCYSPNISEDIKEQMLEAVQFPISESCEVLPELVPCLEFLDNMAYSNLSKDTVNDIIDRVFEGVNEEDLDEVWEAYLKLKVYDYVQEGAAPIGLAGIERENKRREEAAKRAEARKQAVKDAVSGTVSKAKEGIKAAVGKVKDWYKRVSDGSAPVGIAKMTGYKAQNKPALEQPKPEIKKEEPKVEAPKLEQPKKVETPKVKQTKPRAKKEEPKLEQPKPEVKKEPVKEIAADIKAKEEPKKEKSAPKKKATKKEGGINLAKKVKAAHDKKAEVKSQPIEAAKEIAADIKAKEEPKKEEPKKEFNLATAMNKAAFRTGAERKGQERALQVLKDRYASMTSRPGYDQADAQDILKRISTLEKKLGAVKA